MKLKIFTLNWEGGDKLKKLYPSLINSLSNVDYEWIIKDNASKDNSVEYLNSLKNDRIKVIKYKNNIQNFSEGMNLCFSEAAPSDNDLILLLNNDVIFNDTMSLSNMINIINNDNSVGVVGSRLLFTDTNKLQHAGVVFDNNHKLPFHFRSGQKADSLSEKNRLFQVVTGAVLLTKAEYYKNICDNNKSGIKGLNERLVWAFDDVDACLSINYNMNKKIVYCGKTNIFHEESFSLKKKPDNKLFMNHNINLLLSKWNKRYITDFDLYKDNPKYNLYKE